MLSSKPIKSPTNIKSKVIGALIIFVSSVLLWIIGDALFHFLPFVLFVVSLVLLATIYFPALIIGFKLVRYPPEIIVSSQVIRKRVESGRFESKKSSYPAIIYFCGIDGCGKTTQIDLFKQNLASTKLKYSHVNMRFAAMLSYPFFAFCRIFGYTQWKNNNQGTRISEYYFYRNKALSKLYTWLFTLDMFVLVNLKLKWLLWHGNVILCDRCSIDGLVDLMADTQCFDLWNKTSGRLLLSLVSRNSTVILFDIDENNAFARKKDIPNIEFLTVRRGLYLMLSRRLDMTILDANKLKKDLQADLIKLLSHKPFLYFNLVDS